MHIFLLKSPATTSTSHRALCHNVTSHVGLRDNHRRVSQLWVWLCLKQVWAAPLPQALAFWGVTLKMRGRFPLLTPHSSSHSTCDTFTCCGGARAVWPKLWWPASLTCFASDPGHSWKFPLCSVCVCVHLCVCVCVCVCVWFIIFLSSFPIVTACKDLWVKDAYSFVFFQNTHNIRVEHISPFFACSRFAAPLIQKGFLLYTPGRGISLKPLCWFYLKEAFSEGRWDCFAF